MSDLLPVPHEKVGRAYREEFQTADTLNNLEKKKYFQTFRYTFVASVFAGYAHHWAYIPAAVGLAACVFQDYQTAGWIDKTHLTTPRGSEHLLVTARNSNILTRSIGAVSAASFVAQMLTVANDVVHKQPIHDLGLSLTASAFNIAVICCAARAKARRPVINQELQTAKIASYLNG